MRALMFVSILALTDVSSTAAAAAYRSGRVEVDKPWSRPAAAGTNGAGYMTITNRGPAPISVTSVETPLARKAEMHRSIMTGGVMSMKRIESLPVPPGASVSFAPGGYHLMLIGLIKPLKVGDVVPATLTFASGERLKIMFQVEATPGPVKMDHMDMDHTDHMPH